MIDQLLTNVKQIAVMGLGHVGLPLPLLSEPTGPYNAVVVAIAHDECRLLPARYFQLLTPDRQILLDLNVMCQPSDMAGFDGWRL